MTDTEKSIVIYQTLSNINHAVRSDKNALVTSFSGAAAPEAAYCEVVQVLIKELRKLSP